MHYYSVTNMANQLKITSLN